MAYWKVRVSNVCVDIFCFFITLLSCPILSVSFCSSSLPWEGQGLQCFPSWWEWLLAEVRSSRARESLRIWIGRFRLRYISDLKKTEEIKSGRSRSRTTLRAWRNRQRSGSLTVWCFSQLSSVSVWLSWADMIKINHSNFLCISFIFSYVWCWV